MALKIENNSATAYHIVDGAVFFPYAVDAQMAVGQHPLEWSDRPWTQAEIENAREQLNLPPPEPLSPEEQAALDEHNKAVAAAAERLAAFRKKQAEEKAIADQIAADEAMVISPPPQRDTTVRRPFGRKGEPTPAELAAMKKKDQAAADQAKADADQAAKDQAKAQAAADTK